MMKKPQPRSVFFSEDDERDHMLNCMCWLFAEDRYEDLAGDHRRRGLEPGSLEDLADFFKEWVKSGELVIEMHPDGERWRIVPAILHARGSA